MTLEDDNKTPEETATTTSSSTTSTASTTGATSTSNSGLSLDVSKIPDDTLTSSSTPESDDGLKGQIKQKRSFDEISQSSVSSASTTATVPSEASISCDQEMVSSTTPTVNSTTSNTIEEPEQTEEAMAVDEEEVDTNIPPPVLVNFKVVYAKQPFEISMDLNATVSDLKAELQEQTGVIKSMQKLCFRGNLDDQKTLLESGIKAGVKILMIGSKTDDIQALNDNKPEVSKVAIKEKASKEPLCQQKNHKKILDKGIPEFATPGWIGEDISLPTVPLTGMIDKYGNKVRLTFKFETDEVWIGTKERTQKLQMTNVKSVISEPVEGYPQYHLMGLQIGTTEASRLWFYWVPAQYVRAIKRAILND